MSLKVIGAGLPRTGTLSTKRALEQLGFGRCHHMEEIFADPPKSRLWSRHFGGDAVDWDEVFEGYGATVDAPACFAWRELVEHYPDAKVVLTVRDPEPWFASMSRTILAEGYMETILASPIGEMIGRMSGAMMGMDAGPAAPAGPPSREAMLAMREAHNSAVIAGVPPERLLVFQVSQGWEPLCRFLGVPAPSDPFPRINESALFHEHFPAPQAAT